MKTIEVVAAIIRNGDLFLATQRGYGEFKGFWEFPGGKMEVGESREKALSREIREELEIEINIENFLCSTEYDYPQFHLMMHCYICTIKRGSIKLKEHLSARWLKSNKHNSVVWLPADEDIIKRLIDVV